MRLTGQILRNALPMMSDLGTVPHIRLSHESEWLSPIMKYWLDLTVTFPIA